MIIFITKRERFASLIVRVNLISAREVGSPNR